MSIELNRNPNFKDSTSAVDLKGKSLTDLMREAWERDYEPLKFMGKEVKIANDGMYQLMSQELADAIRYKWEGVFEPRKLSEACDPTTVVGSQFTLPPGEYAIASSAHDGITRVTVTKEDLSKVDECINSYALEMNKYLLGEMDKIINPPILMSFQDRQEAKRCALDSMYGTPLPPIKWMKLYQPEGEKDMNSVLKPATPKKVKAPKPKRFKHDYSYIKYSEELFKELQALKEQVIKKDEVIAKISQNCECLNTTLNNTKENYYNMDAQLCVARGSLEDLKNKVEKLKQATLDKGLNKTLETYSQISDANKRFDSALMDLLGATQNALSEDNPYPAQDSFGGKGIFKEVSKYAKLPDGVKLYVRTNY